MALRIGSRIAPPYLPLALGSAVLRLDHVVFGTRDLAATAAHWLDEYGLRALPGGVHPGHGTGNMIVPLGFTYLELITVLDRRVAATRRFSASLIDRIEHDDGWVTWAVADVDLDGTATRLEVRVEQGSRTRPDGQVLRWRTAGSDDPRRTPDLPFFISWDVEPAQHPGAAAVEHPSGATGIANLELEGSTQAFARWTNDAPLPVRIVEGTSAVRSVTVATRDGDVTIR